MNICFNMKQKNSQSQNCVRVFVIILFPIIIIDKHFNPIIFIKKRLYVNFTMIFSIEKMIRGISLRNDGLSSSSSMRSG